MELQIISDMRSAGVTVARFRPPKPYAMKRINHRTHRKLLIADGVVGMTGGVGIAEEWTGNAQDPDHWRDTHVRVRGPGGPRPAGRVRRELAGGHRRRARRRRPSARTSTRSTAADRCRSCAHRRASGTRTPRRCSSSPSPVRRSGCDLTAAYFAPRPAFVQALCDATARGVDVRVLVPGPYIDKEIVRVAGRAVYEELLDCGVRVFEYQPDHAARQVAVDRRRVGARSARSTSTTARSR